MIINCDTVLETQGRLLSYHIKIISQMQNVPLLYTDLTGFITGTLNSNDQGQHVSGGPLPLHTGVQSMLDS